jgi:hypothetical protein
MGTSSYLPIKKPYVIYGYAIPAEKKQSLMLDPMYISTQTWTYRKQ